MKTQRNPCLSRTAKTLFVEVLTLLFFFFVNTSAHADTLYVGNEVSNNVVKINSCGHASVFAPIFVNTNDPEGLAFDRSGNLYVAYNSGCGSMIVKYDPSGNGTIFAWWELGIEVCFPMGLAFDNNGNLYVADYEHYLILKFDSSGHKSVFASSGMYTPNGLAFDSSGNLYVSDTWTNNIVKLNPSGQASVFATANSGLNFPAGLAFDGSGNLYVANPGNDTVVKFDTNGVGSVFANANSGLQAPQGLAFDSNGNLYVANWGNNTIEKFDTNGNGSVFADYSSGLSGPTYLAMQFTKPTIILLGNDPLTNECHTTFSDPGATASEEGTDLSSNIVVSGTVNANVPGTYTLTYTVTDALDNCATVTRTVIVVDTAPPVITCPANIVVNAVCPKGAFVSFASTATDDCSTATVTSTPSSGSVFAIGDTTVTSTATDGAGNKSTCNFKVHVKGATEQIDDLIALVQGLHLKPWVTWTLITRLDAASSALRRGNPQVACANLDAFIFGVDVQTWWGQIWPMSRARFLVRRAQRIRNVLGCYNGFGPGHF
jgi:sugar lactone lactonase YvrE